MIHIDNTKLINLRETSVSFFCIVSRKLHFVRLNNGLGMGCGLVKPHPQSVIKSRAAKNIGLFRTKLLHFDLESSVIS